MIRYTLKCENDHTFESWFQSAEAYETLRDAGHLSCTNCGSTKVEKRLMAPRVRPSRTRAAQPPADPPAAPAVPEKTAPLTMPTGEVEVALRKLRDAVEKNSEYVGDNFASEARRIHDGDSPERSIHGEARPDEARALVEDGVPVLPLPFRPKSKAH